MRRIAIVGAGQAGLQLGLGLLAQGYQVSITTNRTAEQIRAGKVMSSQCMFNTALQTERDLGLSFWEEQCPAVEGIGLTVPNPQQAGSKLIDWSARLERYAQAVDQRLKMPAWMDEFVRRGGELKIEDVGIVELERLVQPAAAGPGPDLCEGYDADVAVLAGGLQPDSRSGRVLRVPGADPERSVRNHGFRRHSRWPDGLLAGRTDPRAASAA